MANRFSAFVKTFKPSDNLSKPDKDTLEQVRNILPQEIIEFWNEFGFGNYAYGLIKIINPLDYMDSLYEWLGRKDISKLPVAVTGFGNIFYYRKLSDNNEDISLLDIHYGKIDVCVYSLNEFFNSFIIDKGIIKEVLKKELFEKALKKKGNLTKDEIYYFVPALMTGGGEEIKYIDKGIGTVHQSFLFQMGTWEHRRIY
jgi:hypothetical protein